MKLKTLKDIFKVGDMEFEEASYNCGCGACGEGYFGSCSVVKIKAEAIKWVKFYQKKKFINDESAQWIRMWIVKFFNITKEDLI